MKEVGGQSCLVCCCFLSKIVLWQGLAGARQRGCFPCALEEVAWCKCLSQMAIKPGRRIWCFFLWFFSFQKVVWLKATWRKLLSAGWLQPCAWEFWCHLEETQFWEVWKQSNVWGSEWNEGRGGQTRAAEQTGWFVFLQRGAWHLPHHGRQSKSSYLGLGAALAHFSAGDTGL